MIDERENKGGADLLALGFGTTAAMWACGFFCRIPSGPIGPDLAAIPAQPVASFSVPSEVLFALFLLCLFGGGFLAGRLTARGWRGGIFTGLISALLNLLIVMGVVGAGSAPLWAAPGFICACMLLCGVGAAVGARFRPARPPALNWPWIFATVAAATTLLLILVGGLVTSFKAGLAVPDWPNTFGSMMFFYPLSKMTGGIYFEHSHRLLGTLVGLTVIVLGAHTAFTDGRRWLRWVLLGALLLVICQGILGGLRVTGRLTLSSSRTDVAPSSLLAAVHGVTAQIFFATMVSLSLFLSTAWRRAERVTVPPAHADRGLHLALVGLLATQLVLGALIRHLGEVLVLHIAVAVVALLFAIASGIRAWGRAYHPAFARAGQWLMALAGIQVLLGLAALFALGFLLERRPSALLQVGITCAHQTCGALVLGSGVVLLLLGRRTLGEG